MRSRAGKLATILLAVGLCFAWAQPAHAAIVLVSKCGDPSGSPSCGTGFSTTGATLFVAINGTNAATCPTDSQSNTWTQVANVTGGAFSGTFTMCYVNGPSTSGSHTFTCGGTLCGVVVGTYSGTAAASPLESSCTGNTGAPTVCTGGGGLTPSTNGSLIFSGTQTTTTGLTVTASLTIQNNIKGVGGVTYGAAFGDLVQGTAANINPGWNDDSTTGTGVNVTAVFKPSAGGGGCTAPPGQLMTMGIGNCKGDE